MGMVDVTCLIPSVVLLVLAVQYGRGRWLRSMAGYDAAEEGDKVDLGPYAKRIASVAFWLGLLFLAWALEGCVRPYAPVVADAAVLTLEVLSAVAFVRLLRLVFSRGRR